MGPVCLALITDCLPCLISCDFEPGTDKRPSYYTQESFSSNGKNKITSFKPGFRMTVGKPGTGGSASHTGLRFVCLDTKNTRFPELPDFPTKPCRGGIMTVHHFPACWDGKNLDSPDHQSHMYNTVKDAFQVSGPCPTSHPVRMPQVAYETLWDTAQFASLWPAGGANPFVLSYGDVKGYGTHVSLSTPNPPPSPHLPEPSHLY